MHDLLPLARDVARAQDVCEYFKRNAIGIPRTCEPAPRSGRDAGPERLRRGYMHREALADVSQVRRKRRKTHTETREQRWVSVLHLLRR